MVRSPEAYAWSSYRVHAMGEDRDWLELHHVYLALGRDSQRRAKRRIAHSFERQ